VYQVISEITKKPIELMIAIAGPNSGLLRTPAS
jgi:hypothetical protein